MKSLLRWAGSKRQLISQLKSYWDVDPTRRYVEPFAGSAALFFHVEPARAIISDLNLELIYFYRTIKRFPADVYTTASHYAVNEKTYYKIRESLPNESDPIRKSAMFYYLNRYCFNGIYRTNSLGHFNVPFSGVNNGAFPAWEEFRSGVKALRKASTACMDFETIIDKNVTSRDFVYLDPPYAVANRRVFRQYNAQSFGLEDIQRLSEVLDEINKRNAKFVLSYALCKESLKHFSKWINRRVQCQRNVSGFAKNRRRAVELIVTNIAIA